MNRLGAFEGLKQTVAHFGLSVHDRGCPFSGRPCYLLVFFDELDHGLLLLLYATISKYGIHYDHLWLIIVSLTVTFIHCLLVVRVIYAFPIVLVHPHSTIVADLISTSFFPRCHPSFLCHSHCRIGVPNFVQLHRTAL